MTLPPAALLLPILLATPAFAQARENGVVALSPAERSAAIEAGARDSGDGFTDAPINGRRPHGEIGMEIGSNGSRALYGTTAIPLGQTGYAAFSFMTGQSGRLRAR